MTQDDHSKTAIAQSLVYDLAKAITNRNLTLDQPTLLAELQEKVIAPAEAKTKALAVGI